MRRRGVYPLALAGLAAMAVCAVGPAWAGTIKGIVRAEGVSTEPRKLPVTIDQYVCGKEKDAEDLVLSPERGVRNVVVSLQNPPPVAKPSEAPPPVQIDQKQCVFVPRVVVVPAGGTVEFLSSDRLLHNIHSVTKENPSFNRTQPKGRTISVVFKKPEIVRIDCDLHSWMRAWVVVTEHPFYAISNERGEFVLENVPAGKYTLQFWQETLGTVTRDVTVAETGVTTVTVVMAKR
jgi:plastocyanin